MMKVTPNNLLATGLTLIFAMGKVTGLLDWSWWLVFLPVLIFTAATLILLAMFLILAFIGIGTLTVQRKDNEKRNIEKRIAAWRAQQQPRQHRAEPTSEMGGDEPGPEQ
jgi:hypothetical protein